MKSNTHNISKDNSCAVLFAIFEYKIREATSSLLTESGGGEVCALAVKARSRSRAVVPARDSQSKETR